MDNRKRKRPVRQQSLIPVIQAAINGLKVPESCEGKMSGEYVKRGMRLAIEAINSAITKYKSSL